MHRLPFTTSASGIRQPRHSGAIFAVHEARRDAAPGRRAPLPRVRRAHRRDERPQDGRRAVRIRRVLPSRRRARVFAKSGERLARAGAWLQTPSRRWLPPNEPSPVTYLFDCATRAGSRAGVAGAPRGAGSPRSPLVAAPPSAAGARRGPGWPAAVRGTRLRGSPSPPLSAALTRARHGNACRPVPGATAAACGALNTSRSSFAQRTERASATISLGSCRFSLVPSWTRARRRRRRRIPPSPPRGSTSASRRASGRLAAPLRDRRRGSRWRR